MGEGKALPDWLIGRRLKTDPREIPGDAFIERTFKSEDTGKDITVFRSTETDPKTGDPFKSIDTATGQPVDLTPEERYDSFIGFSIQPPQELVRELESRVKSNGRR